MNLADAVCSGTARASNGKLHLMTSSPAVAAREASVQLGERGAGVEVSRAAGWPPQPRVAHYDQTADSFTIETILSDLQNVTTE